MLPPSAAWPDRSARYAQPSGKAPGRPKVNCTRLTFGHQEHLGDVVAGYGTDVDLDVIRAWWSLRSLCGVRWLVEHGFDPFAPGCEVDVLRSRL